MIPSIAYPLPLGWPDFTPLFFSALLLSLLVAVLALRQVLVNPWRLVRPALLFAGLFNLLFQWPSVVFASAFAADLPNVVLFYAAIHLTPLLLIGWVFVSPRLDVTNGGVGGATFTPWHFVIPIVVLGTAAGLFLARMPFDCTALFAMLADPAMTMLAREFTIKFANSTLATTSYGALVNTAAPIVVALALWQMMQAVRQRRPVRCAMWLVLIVIAAGLVLIGGAKGNLVPSFIVAFAAVLGWSNSLRSRALAACGLAVALVSCLVIVELARERPSGGNGVAYDFPMCTVRLNTCAGSMDLVASLQRDEALGLSRQQITDLSRRLALLCRTDAAASDAKGDARVMVASLGGADPWQNLVSADDLRDRQRYLAVAQVDGATVALSIQYGPMTERILPYIGSIGYRALVVPIQAAAWHYLYVAEHGAPGLMALPIGRRLMGGEVINMPQLVYQAYGSIYSGGDVTSTSTAPTGFALAYPAYLGVPGVALVVGLLVSFDAVFMMLAKQLGRPALPLAGGLAAVSTMNFLLSDFLTSLGSHGGLAAVAIIGMFALVERLVTSRGGGGLRGKGG
ncbi:hypothetical protein [Devosia lacusdianchii]|uniref:hypothetical protein n=1 Tax=Devosia lacusdianchii TaxID=2917991 RepID=UPI001F066FFA|nr:hypothetical protein [Devosia sp. JXJ CY 41]